MGVDSNILHGGTIINPNIQTEYLERHIFKIYYQEKFIDFLEFSYKERILTVGRGEESDIVLNSSVVSKKHMEICVKGESCWLIDIASQNSTFVNQERVDSPRLLHCGDNISIRNSEQNEKNTIRMEYIKISPSILLIEKKFKLIDKNKVVIGRQDEDCDIVLKHPNISCKHVQLNDTPNGWVIEDLQTTNGTYVNGNRIIRKKLLKNNDCIFIGNTKFIFKVNELTYTIMDNGILLDAINVSKDVINNKKTKTLVSDVSISIKPGEFVAIVGGSGTGKSTLMDCLNGFRPATSGTVMINRDDLYSNFGAYKTIIGYVPQQDIVYDHLTVYQMLYYSAKLRLPKDFTAEDINKRIVRVIGSVFLTGKENMQIKKLSGGQRKRTSIAIELLAEPKLIFLDEPTSGLDPGIDKNMMELLKNLSREGVTIVLITHATSNIRLCDKVIFLGIGGKLCYFGDPNSMAEFFEVKEIADIYVKLSITENRFGWSESRLIEIAEYYNAKYQKTPLFEKIKKHHAEIQTSKQTESYSNNKGNGAIRQFIVLMRRYFKLILCDKVSLAIMLGQAPLMGIILKLVNKNDSFNSYEGSKQILFTISCMIAFMGLLNAFMEVCKERDILKREYSVGVGLFPYLMSKIVILGLFCVVQATLFVAGAKMVIDFPQTALFYNDVIELWITIILSLVASTSMGLLISAYSKTTQRATLMMPVAIIPQLVFAGVLFELLGVAKWISNLVVSKWTMSAMGSLFDINSLPLKVTLTYPKLQLVKRELNSMYEHTQSHIISCWLVLVLFTAICIFLSIMLLRRNLKDET